MNKIILIFFLAINFILAQSPFDKGINLTNWFQSNSAEEIPFSKYSKEDFIYLKSIGFNIIRLPIKMHFMLDESKDKNFDPYFLFLLDKVVDWAEDVNINIILDNHSYSTSVATGNSIDSILLPVWRNMAMHFKDRSKLIYYEIFNEPHGISNKIWDKIQINVINEIRKIDTVHTIIVGASNFYGYQDLDSLSYYSDDNLIYTFHFYDPFLFTHQGADWTSLPMDDVKYIPFPYRKLKMPGLNEYYKNTWVESIYNNYNIKGTYKYLSSQLKIIKNFAAKRNVRVFCGEFGVLSFYSSVNSRVNWNKFVSDYFDENNISWTFWDYEGDYGLLNPNFKESDYYKLFQSIGLNYYKKSDHKTAAEDNSINIFSNFVGNGISPIKSHSNKTTGFSIIQNKKDDFSILWKDAVKFNSLIFDFVPDIDLSNKNDENSFLSFRIKTDSKSIKFDVRFVDSKIKGKNDHPWRNSYTIDSKKYNFYNKWLEVNIPINSFREKGSWDKNKWYNPSGKFDWTKVDKLEFAQEYNSLAGKSIWIDDIIIK